MKIHTVNNSFKFLGVLSALSLLVVSCDEHERIDNDIHVGYILCSDGQVVSPDCCEQSGKDVERLPELVGVARILPAECRLDL